MPTARSLCSLFISSLTSPPAIVTAPHSSASSSSFTPSLSELRPVGFSPQWSLQRRPAQLVKPGESCGCPLSRIPPPTPRPHCGMSVVPLSSHTQSCPRSSDIREGHDLPTSPNCFYHINLFHQQLLVKCTMYQMLYWIQQRKIHTYFHLKLSSGFSFYHRSSTLSPPQPASRVYPQGSWTDGHRRSFQESRP